MEELTNSLAVLFAGAVVLAPVMAISLRIALKPFWESYLRMRERQTPELLEKRVALLEAELQHIDQTLSRLADADDFQRRLGSAASPASDEQGRAERTSRADASALSPRSVEQAHDG